MIKSPSLDFNHLFYGIRIINLQSGRDFDQFNGTRPLQRTGQFIKLCGLQSSNQVTRCSFLRFIPVNLGSHLYIWVHTCISGFTPVYLVSSRFAESCFAESRFAETRFAESRFAESRFAESRFAESRFAESRFAETRFVH